MTDLAKKVLEQCRSQEIMLATAESCTGGLIVGSLTEIAGSSDVVDCGFVTYSNEAKMRILGVSETTLREVGAVSEAVAFAMAEGALLNSRAEISVAVTGVAGPGGGSVEKPVGLVHLACARHGRETLHREERFGDIGRSEVRTATVISALELLLEQLS